MSQINIHHFFSVMRESDLQFDVQQQLELIVKTVNELSEETLAKRYAMLVSE